MNKETRAEKQTFVSDETSEWWTSLSTSHDERIMTAIARSNARTRCHAKICDLADAKFGWLAITFRAHESAMTADAFSGPSCVCTKAW